MIHTLQWLEGSRWHLVPLKYMLAERITDGPHETPAFLNEGMPFLSVDGIQDGEVTLENCRFVAEDQHREFRLKAAPRRGDILFGKAASTGKIARVKSDIEFSIWSPLALLRPNERVVLSEFLDYALKSSIAQGQVDVLVTHNTQNNISMDAIPRIRIPLPALEEQDAICRFLNSELSPIENLLRAKQRLLGLLAEKRTTIIATAVKRGLDPKVKLRDSGVTWLGRVPAHWSTPPVYARYEVQLGKMLDERRITKRFLAPYLRNSDVQWDRINVDDLPEMDFDESEQKLYALRPGDILLCEGGEIGRCAIWDSDRRCFYQKALHRLRPTTDRDDPRYFVLVMRAAVEAGLFTSQASAATIQHLPAEKLRIVRYPAPPIEEQRAIVAHIARETAKLDAVRTATERTIALLKERRAALIAAAVTGQLDVGAAA